MLRALYTFLCQWTRSFGFRFAIVFCFLMVYVAVITRCATDTLLTHREDYAKLTSKLSRSSVPIGQLRGCIFGENGEMIAASLPQFDMFFDFRSADDEYTESIKDPITKKKIRVKRRRLPADTMAYYFSANGPGSRALAMVDPKHRSAAQLGQTVLQAFRNRPTTAEGKKNYKRLILIRGISYLDYKQLRDSLPFFRKGPNRTCCNYEERPHRYRPYGDRRLASSTIGGVYASDTYIDADGQRINLKGHGLNGLECTFDSLLAGEPGRGISIQVHRRPTTIVQQAPIDGADVYTTLDMEMQRILDYELNKRIIELNAHGGWAAFVETSTGKVKAISNLLRKGDVCEEDYNHFVQDRYDPGSTFKTVSYMVMLDDGKITPETIVDTENYDKAHPHHWVYHTKTIRDDHPVGIVTARKAIEQSSNIGIAKLATAAYENDPQRYLDLVYETGVFDDMHLNTEFQGALAPRKRQVNERRWSKPSLAQISYGYETEIPAIAILAFYNAIANDGKMMRPYIVDRAEKAGDVIYKREPEVVKSKICTSATLKAVREALLDVVEHGTARTEWKKDGTINRQGVKSRKLKIAGKTGTAQRYDHGTYIGTGHYVSFAGFFPADNPQYTGIVVIDVRPGSGNPQPGGGYMAGPVFRNFAEQVYALSCTRKVKEIEADSVGLSRGGMMPQVKRGPEATTASVLDDLDLDLSAPTADITNVTKGQVPNVKGMGAADALYMLEAAGLRVSVRGHGMVEQQSLSPGSSCQQGTSITIYLK